MKKVLAASLFCAVSSFATWDLFPAQDAGKGEAKLGFQYGMPAEKVSTMGINVGARYSIIEGLEASVMLDGQRGGYVISSSLDGNDMEISGLDRPIVGIRYWLPMGLGIAADVIIPAGGEKVAGDEPQLGLNAGVQFSTKITEEFALGSEAMLAVINKINKDASAGMVLGIQVEGDYTVGPATPYLGIDLQQGLTKGDMPEAAKMQMGLSVGTVYNINESMYAQVHYWMGLVGDVYKDYAPKTVTISYGLKF
ncbi:MAG: hypothetical protein LBC87_09905 [Fibromonadaceae bacterium]|jgi:hypothetical protein|nr:hypothetical protein [Fibromonadaceae bacterium]